MKTNIPFRASIVLLATACTLFSAQAQNPPCYLCGGDTNAAFLLPDKEIPVDDTTTITCGEVFTSAVSGEFTPDECNEASMSVELAEFCGCSNLQSPTTAPVEVPIAPIATTLIPTTTPIRDGTIPPTVTPVATVSPTNSPTPPKTMTLSPTISPTPPKTATVSPTISPTPPKSVSDVPSTSPSKSLDVPLTPVAQNTLKPTTAPVPVDTLAPTIAPSATTVVEPTFAPVIAGSDPPSVSSTTPCRKKKKGISKTRKGMTKSNGSGKRQGKRDSGNDDSEERLLRTSGNGGDEDDEYEYACPKPKGKDGMVNGKGPITGEKGSDDDDTATPSEQYGNNMALKEKGGVKEKKKKKSASLRYL